MYKNQLFKEIKHGLGKTDFLFKSGEGKNKK